MTDTLIQNPKDAGCEVVLRCAWLLNPAEPPRQHVRISVVDGHVCEIASLPADERSQAAPVALLPQLVNAHTHLEFSRIEHPLTPQFPFTDWIRSVIRYRRSQDPAAMSAGVSSGVVECANSGSGLVGEITTSDDGLLAFRKHGKARHIGGVSFREVIGFLPEQLQKCRDEAVRHTEQADDGHIGGGLSPHAPYSVHPDLFEAIVDIAAGHDIPVAMHLAETRDELELLDCQRGTFVDFLRSLDLWDSSVLQPGTRPLRYLQKLAQAPRALAVHGNYFGPDEIAFLARHPNVAVVYCPRTHAYFGHSPHPWLQLRDAGAVVVLGTDSRASNPDLAIWRELQLATRQSGQPIHELLSMVTTAAATALGFAADVCRIRVGQPLRAIQIACGCDSLAALQTALVSSPESPQPVLV